MDDISDSSMDFLVTAADLRLGQEEVVVMLERLAKMFELALPENTTVTRGGWFLSKEKPVQGLVVGFGDQSFKLERDGKSHVRASLQKSVRGVVLKTAEIQLDEWTHGVAEELTKLAAHSTRARAALTKLTQG